MWSARTALPLAIVGIIAVSSRVASACHPRTVCLRWGTEIIDDEFGEYVLGETIPARGTKVQLFPPPPEPPLTTFLDQEGCLTFHSQYAYGHKIMVYNEAWIGSLDPLEMVQIRVTRQYTANGATQSDFMWPVDLHGIAPNDVVPVTIDTEQIDPIAPLMAIATAVMHRFYELDVFPPTPASLEIEFEDWRGNARGWCNHIEVGPDSFREKFLVAHEMGHWLQCHWDGYFGPLPDEEDYKYGDNGDPRVPEEPCQFAINPPKDLMGNTLMVTDGGYHGLRSAEWSGAALREGFAHFIASVVFNDTSGEDGIFRYYKDIDISMLESYEDFVDPMLDNSRVSLFGDPMSCDPCYGGEPRWTESQCLPDWNEGGVSNGMDWMRFFWYFLAKEGDSPTLREILEFFDFAEDNDTVLLEFGFDLYNVGPTLRAALGESALSDFADRFEEANCVMGVYDDIACTP